MREGFKNNEKFRSLIDNISDGIIALDTNWQVDYLNAAAEKILNRKPSYLIEKNIWEEFPDSVDGKFYKAYHEAMQTQESIVIEDYWKNGQEPRSILLPKGLPFTFMTSLPNAMPVSGLVKVKKASNCFWTG